MTLNEMAVLITTEMGLYDETSVSLTRQFLNKEYVTLWDKYPWVDTQVIRNVTVLAGHNTIAFPGGIRRTITVRATNLRTGVPDDPVAEGPTTSVRSDSRFLDPVSATFLIETDPTIFERGGYVRYYEEVPNINITAGIEGGDAATSPPGTLPPAAPGPIFPGIRVYPTAMVDTELTIVGKGICQGLIHDNDKSVIRNLDPALIAYAMFDMLQRQRQYGKAEVKRKEAQELETVAWNLEQQQTNQPRRTKATTVAGNSLAEMTDAVCMLCGQWTPDYRLIIREFLRRNYQTLYDSFLWPESLVVVRVPYTTEQLILPHYVDKVLGIRGTSNTRLFPAEAGLLLDISPSVFESIGDPISYTTLTPVAVATIPPVTTQLVIASTSAIDTGMVAVRGEIISVGVEREEQVQLNGITPVQTINAYDIPLTISKDITVGDVTVNAATDARLLEIIPSYQREMKHQRLWLLPNPNSDALIPEPAAAEIPAPTASSSVFTCLVLAKRAIHPLLTNEDTPIITGAQQVLIAAAAADLFRKLEKHDMANAMLQKTDGSMKVLKDKNTDQAASSPRFVPQIEPRAYVASSAW